MPQKKPHLDLADIAGNSFRLLTRAKNLLREAKVSHAEIVAFDLMAGGDAIRRTATIQQGPSVYQRVFDEVRKRFVVWDGDKQAA